MLNQFMQLYAETSLAVHVSAAISNAFMNMVRLNLSTYSELYAAYQYLVPLSVKVQTHRMPFDNATRLVSIFTNLV
jgi:hypothetical protein